VNLTEETRVLLNGLGAISIDEVPITLEDAFVSYLGGSLETIRLSDAPEPLEVAGGVA